MNKAPGGGWGRDADGGGPMVAFTLIELLVVVGIIAILAGLLLPALARGKAAARGTECRQNLRDLGIALRLYVDEANAYPPGGTGGVLAQIQDSGWIMLDDWKEILAPSIGIKEDVNVLALRKLRCPELVSSGTVRGNGQYAYNAFGTGKFGDGSNLGLGGWLMGQPPKFRATPESAVLAPSDMVAVGDIGVKPNQTLFWTSGRFDPVSTQQWMWPGQSHNRRANLVFCDVHVESGRPTNWIAASEAVRSRWNVDHQPHPETWKPR